MSAACARYKKLGALPVQHRRIAWSISPESLLWEPINSYSMHTTL